MIASVAISSRVIVQGRVISRLPGDWAAVLVDGQVHAGRLLSRLPGQPGGPATMALRKADAAARASLQSPTVPLQAQVKAPLQTPPQTAPQSQVHSQL